MKLLVKLSLTVGILSLFTIGSLVTLAYFPIASELQQAAATKNSNLATQLISGIDRFLYERQSDLSQIAASTEVQELLAIKRPTPAQTSLVSNELSDTRASSDLWASFELLGRDGTVLAAASATPSTSLITANPNLADQFAQALQNHASVSDLFVEQTSGEPAIIYLAPVTTSTGVAGVMAGVLSWPPLENLIHDSQVGSIHLLNQTGAVIASNQLDITKPLITSFAKDAAYHQISQNLGKATTQPAFGQPATKSLVVGVAEPGFLSYSGHHWLLVLESPLTQVDAPAQALAWHLILFIAPIAVAASAVLIFFMSRQIIRPVQRLSTTINRITLGDLSQTAPVTSGDEVGKLSQNFNEMVYQLANTQRGLQASNKAATERRAQLESSINGLRQGFVIADAEGKIFMRNQAAIDILHLQPGAPDSADLGHLTDVSSLLPKEVDLLKEVKQVQTKREAAKLPGIGLSGRFINLYLSPVANDNTVIGSVLLLEDITEERILQRSRDEFFSIASHELRTPLTAIRGNTSMILQYFPEAVKDPSMKEMVGDIHDSSVRLIEIVNDFLDASRLEQDKMQFNLRAFAVEPIIERIIYELSGLSREKNIFINFDQHTLGKLPMVYADPNRVKQILYNLVGNGMKFTEKGGITINCLFEHKLLKVTVTDTGQGISPEGQQILFHKFQQSTSSILTRDNTRGTGLGLYISKLLVEHMGGQIRLEHTEPGKGSTFSFTLPVATTQQIEAAATLPAVSTAEESTDSTEPPPPAESTKPEAKS
ncbi:MAG TPA: ATP-binding protein, partial [Candidatus Saccharimonas sp.]|nr:ATP-binding protein [Candidatus Saccharimonas sp.]